MYEEQDIKDNLYSAFRDTQSVTVLGADNENQPISLADFEIIGRGLKESFTVRRKSTNNIYELRVLPKEKVLAGLAVPGRDGQVMRNLLCLGSYRFIQGVEYAFQSNTMLYLIMEQCVMTLEDYYKAT